VALYTPASFVMFPRWRSRMTAVIAFGPLEGFTYAMSGVILGRDRDLPARQPRRARLGAAPRRRAAEEATQILRQRGLIAVTLVRLGAGSRPFRS